MEISGAHLVEVKGAFKFLYLDSPFHRGVIISWPILTLCVFVEQTMVGFYSSLQNLDVKP